MNIIERMAAKYLKVIEFYTEAKNPEQVTLAKGEFQEVLRVKSEVTRIFQVELQEDPESIEEVNSEKVQYWIASVKTAFADVLYNAGKFNFTMLEWAIKEIVKEEDQERKKQLELQKQTQATQQTGG